MCVIEAWAIVSLSQLVLGTESYEHIVILTLLIVLFLINELIPQHRIPPFVGYPPLHIVHPISIEQIVFNLSQLMNSNQLTQIQTSQIKAMVEQFLPLHCLEQWPCHVLQVIAWPVDYDHTLPLAQKSQMLNQLQPNCSICQERLGLLSSKDTVKLSFSYNSFLFNKLSLPFHNIIYLCPTPQLTQSLSPNLWIFAQIKEQSLQYFRGEHLRKSRLQKRMVEIAWDLYKRHSSSLELAHGQDILYLCPTWQLDYNRKVGSYAISSCCSRHQMVYEITQRLRVPYREGLQIHQNECNVYPIACFYPVRLAYFDWLSTEIPLHCCSVVCAEPTHEVQQVQQNIRTLYPSYMPTSLVHFAAMLVLYPLGYREKQSDSSLSHAKLQCLTEYFNDIIVGRAGEELVRLHQFDGLIYFCQFNQILFFSKKDGISAIYDGVDRIFEIHKQILLCILCQQHILNYNMVQNAITQPSIHLHQLTNHLLMHAVHKTLEIKQLLLLEIETEHN